jgi:hypothetical protein
MGNRENLAALTSGPTRRRAIVGVMGAFGGLTWSQLGPGRKRRMGYLIRQTLFTRSLTSRRARSESMKHSLMPDSLPA